MQANSAGGASLSPRRGRPESRYSPPPACPTRPCGSSTTAGSPTDLRTQRFVISAYDIDSLKTNVGETAALDYDFPRLSNQYFNATFISDEQDIIYNCELRKSGSPWTRSDNVGCLEGQMEDARRQALPRIRQALDRQRCRRRQGLPQPDHPPLALPLRPRGERERVRPGDRQRRQRSLREDVEPNANDFLKRNWEDGEKGELYRIDDEWWFADNWSRSNRNADWSLEGDRRAGALPCRMDQALARDRVRLRLVHDLGEQGRRRTPSPGMRSSAWPTST